MTERSTRETVDLSAYPDLVMVLLGMRAHSLLGVRTLLTVGPQIQRSVKGDVEGLLKHNLFLFSPIHVGIRQYWRDFESLERWTRTEPHSVWWRDLLADGRGTSFWHEAYHMRGGIEGIFLERRTKLGLTSFAPVVPARKAMFSSRRRVHKPAEAELAPVVTERDHYGIEE